MIQKSKLINYLISAVIFIILQLTLLNCSVDNNNNNDNDISPIKTDITFESLNQLLNDAIPGMIDNAVIPGLQIAVIKNNQILWNSSFGLKNNDTQTRINDQTIFQACSLSKPIFAYAVLKLVEEGVLELDRPLLEYVPASYIINEFNHGNPINDRFNRITTRMVLTHSTGFPNWRSNNSIDFIFEPGERFGYSGEGFVYLQKIVEYLLEKTLNEFMTEIVFEPLGMSRSSYVWKEEMEQHITNGHEQSGQVNPIARPTTGNAAGSLLTTAEDFAKFILAITNNIGITEETVNSMLTSQIQAPKVIGGYSSVSETISWGLGIGLQQTEFGKAFWHWGDNHDFKCLTITYPIEKIGLVYFTNSYNGLLIADELIRTAIGGYNPAMDWLGYPYSGPGN